jgi:hypothetical protein
MKFLIPSLFLVFALNQVSYADVVKIPVGDQEPVNAEVLTEQLPAKGQLMSEVQKKFGPPALRTEPVGKPPITRWEYTDFIVYFEYEHVIHSVIKFSRHYPVDQEE